MYKFIIKTFDQLKNDDFDQVKFDQVIIPQLIISRKAYADNVQLFKNFSERKFSSAPVQRLQEVEVVSSRSRIGDPIETRNLDQARSGTREEPSRNSENSDETGSFSYFVTVTKISFLLFLF